MKIHPFRLLSGRCILKGKAAHGAIKSIVRLPPDAEIKGDKQSENVVRISDIMRQVNAPDEP